MAVEYVRGYQQGDSLKRVPVHLPDGFPGGDTAIGVQKVEQRFAYSVPQVVQQAVSLLEVS